MKYIRYISTLLVCTSLLLSCQSTGTHMDTDKQNKRAKIHYQIGLDSLNRGQLAKAFDELMKSNSILPKQPEVLDALAYAWRLRGDLKQSEAFYKQALAAGAGSSTYTNYGGLLVALKRYQDAEKVLNKALEDPRYRNQYIAQIHLGDALLGLGKFDDAIKSYRLAGLLNPQQDISQLREAKAYVQTQRFNYAFALYETILRKTPNNRPALQGLIDLLHQQPNTKIARKYISAYIEHEKEPLNRAWAEDALIHLGQQH